MSVNTFFVSGQQQRHYGGFVMIEALIAFVVLAAGLLALMSFHGTTQKSTAEAKAQSQAVALAEAKLQVLESFLLATDPRLLEGEGSDAPPGVAFSFERSWSVADDPLKPDLKNARVTVSWQDREGMTRAVVLASDIHVADPAAGIENLLELVVASHQAESGVWVAETAPENSEDAQTEDGEGSTEQETGEPDDVEPDEPDEVHTLNFTITISGGVTISANGGKYDGVTGEGITCQKQNGYICTTGLFALGSSWSGAIDFHTNKNVCAPEAPEYVVENRNTGNLRYHRLRFSNITKNMTVDVRIC